MQTEKTLVHGTVEALEFVAAFKSNHMSQAFYLVFPL